MKTVAIHNIHTYSFEFFVKRHVALLTMLGSLLIIIGTLLPWVTIMGGLQSFTGIAGLNGRLLLASGIVSFLAGAVYGIKPIVALRWGIGLFGFAQLAFCGWLLLGLWKTYQQITQDTMVLGGIGPGLFIVTLGTLLVFGTLILSRK